MFNAQQFSVPLAERLRPKTLTEFFGQEHIVGVGKLLYQLIVNHTLSSLILWGPPGVGKTTLSHIIAEETGSVFVTLSGVSSGKEDLKQVVKEAGQRKKADGTSTLLFIDEIHRWNKAQQDALLPYVEQGVIILIGATTENPSFEINGALLSRSRVFILEHLGHSALLQVIDRALQDSENGLGAFPITIDAPTKSLLSELAGGDARVALNTLELAVKSQLKQEKIVITTSDIKEALQRTSLVFDKKGEEFYNTISALHKSMRGSDVNASLYWLARMLEGGVDPLYLARRIVRFASEDIGVANSEALVQTISAYQACHFLGYPECNVHLAQAVVYCAKSAKSNLLYRAYRAAAEDARATSHLGVPLHLRNAPTRFMKDVGYGQGYQYNPDYEAGEVEQKYLPPELIGRNYLKK